MNWEKGLTIIGLIAAISLVIFLYFQSNILGPHAPGDLPNPILKVGEIAPNLVLTDINGKVHELKDYKGKVVLINFWASWCPPCIAEMPSLGKAYLKLKNQGFEVLAVNLDENSQMVLKFIEEQKISFKVFLDPQGKAAQEYLVYGLPYTVLLDREGKIQFKVFGGHEWDKGGPLKRIEALL